MRSDCGSQLPTSLTRFRRLWDGLLSGSDRILVLGATNRPNDIDSAILRRMPKRFSVGLPNLDQRLKILSLVCFHLEACRRVLTQSSSGAQRHKAGRRLSVGAVSRTDRWSFWLRLEGTLSKCRYGSNARADASSGAPRRDETHRRRGKTRRP